MSLARRLRMKLLTSMCLVAIAAVFLAGYVSWWREQQAKERRAKWHREHVALLKAELQRAEDRLRWADQMQQRGYLSKAALSRDHAQVQDVRSRLAELEKSSKLP